MVKVIVKKNRGIVCGVMLACFSAGLLIPMSAEAKTVAITTGTDPANFDAQQGTSNQLIDSFDVSQTGGGTGGITQVVVTTTGTANAAAVYIKDATGATTYGSSTTSSGNTWTIALTGFPTATTAGSGIYVDVAASATVGQTVTAYISSFTTGGTNGGSTDTGVTTMTIAEAPAQLVHNSNTLGTKYGTWGTTYDCNTCHRKNSTNVKLVQENIVTPLGSRPVVFTRMTASVANTQGTFGDDLRTTYANGSRNVCEVCHHQTLHHQYSSTKIADRSTNPHYNRKDCTACHPHSAGFKGAGCDGCHGNPPISTATLVTSPEATLALGNPPTSGGAHATHVTSEGMICTTCHSGNTMPTVSKTIQMGFDINNTNWPGFAGTAVFGSFSGHTPLGGSPAYTFVSSKSGTVVNTSSSYRNSCNVYCHGQWTGANGSLNPSWIVTDGSQSACGTCHGATAAAPPQTGKHVTHASNSAGNYGFSCTKCHPNPNGFSHVNGSVQWRLSSSTTGLIGSTATYTPGSGTAGISGQTNSIAPSATYGTCTNIYCHSTAQATNGTATPVYTSPKWSDAALSCGGCHVDMSTSASATGDHVKHAQTNAITCAICHNGYTATSVNTATHVNKTIELTFSGNATGTAYSQGSGPVGNGYGTCSTSYCHSTGQSSTGGATPTYPATAPTWGTTTTNCGSCHVNMSTDATGTGDHLKHAGSTGNAKYGCPACHSGYTATTVNTATHVNKTIELTFSGNATGTTYSQGNGPVGNGYGYCSASKCHGQGYPIWGGGLYSATVTCENCHGSATTNPFYSTATGTAGAAPTKVTAASDSKVGAHTDHLTSGHNYANNVACSECHVVPTLTNMTGHYRSGTAATLTFGTLAKTASLVPAYSAGTCTNVYCHGDSLPQFSTTQPTVTWSSTTYLTGTSTVGNGSTTRGTGDCAACHCYPPLNSTHAGKAANSCSGCHSHVNAQGTGFSDVTKHIDGAIEASGGHSTPYYGYTHQVDAGTSPFSSCTGCHTNTKSTSYPFPGTGSAPDCQNCHTKASPVGSTTNGCHSCHGTSGGGGRPTGTAYPDRVAKHTSISQHNTTCTTCHDLGATSKFGTGYARHGWANNKKTYLTYSSVKRKLSVYTVNAARTGTSTRNSGDGTCSGNLGCCSSHGSSSWY